MIEITITHAERRALLIAIKPEYRFIDTDRNLLIGGLGRIRFKAQEMSDDDRQTLHDRGVQ